MSFTSAFHALLYVVAMWPDCHFRDKMLHLHTSQATSNQI